MKHRKLSVSLTLLIGAVCLSGDSWKKCTNNCETQYQKDLSNDLAVYNTSVQQAAGHYAQCTNPLCLNGGTTFGCCTQSALNNDCYPLNSDGSCKNQAAYDSDYSACKTQFCGTGNCPADPLLCQQGNGGTCCSVYGTETNLAQAAKDSADHQANQQYGQNVAGCQTGCGCSTGDDCSQANQDSQCDTGNACLGGLCRSCPSGSHVCQNGTSCATQCMDNPNQQCAGDTCTGGAGNGVWQCQDTDGGWMYQCTTSQGGSPIVIDVNGQGFQLTDAAHGVNFDFFGDGKKVQIAWTARGSGNAWLVLPNEKGLVASGKNMFGNITPQPPSNDPNGFLALAVYDQPKNGGNGDGIIDARDAIFSKLRLWQDKNHDGISQPGELFTLPQLGVVSISLRYTETKWTDVYGNLFHYRAAIQDAASAQSPQWTYDVFLVMEKAQ